MLNLSNEVFNALSKYLSERWNIDQFRDFVVGLQVDKYNLLADVDKMFVNEFEGRYAEYSDFGHNEQLLKAAIARYVLADEAASPQAAVGSWFLPSSQSTGSFSMGSLSAAANFSAASVSELEFSAA